jgi:hypothetical protein
MTKQNALVPASDAQQISIAGQPAGGRTKRNRGKAARILAGAAVTASVAAVGLAGLALGGTNAYADTLTNGPTVHLGQYPVPSTPPAYANDGDLLPLYDGTVGNPAAIVLTGSTVDGTAIPEVIQITGNSTDGGSQVATGLDTQASGQAWYFQRVGYIDVTTPETSQLDAAGNPELLATPVYRIVNYNPGGTFTCLEGFGATPGAGSPVESWGCDPDGASAAANQLWIVGSPAQSNHTHDAATDAYDGGSAPQVYSDYLQGSTSGLSGLQGSVLENVASLSAGGWNTATAPVLSADAGDAEGILSELTLQPQTAPASSANSTWNIVDSSAAPGSSGWVSF